MNKSVINMLRPLVVLVLFAISLSASGASTVRTTVTKILSDDVNYGGCMAYIATSPKDDQGLACTSSLSAVTFDCLNSRGTTNKSLANTKFQSAQLALVTGADIKLKVTSRGGLPNGVCFAEWIQVFPAS